MYSGFAVRTRLRRGRAFYPPPAMIGWGGTGKRYGSEVLYHHTESEARAQSQQKQRRVLLMHWCVTQMNWV